MRTADFDAAIRRLVSPLVEPWGFTCSGGKGCSFRRQVAPELFHFIVFDIKKNRTEYEVQVFPATPRLGPEQWTSFPNFVGIPTGTRAGLNAKHGVGGGASRFPCKDEMVLESVLQRVVLPAIEKHAPTYLAAFCTLQDLIPVLESPQWAALLREA
jgi:hypothetical protein